MNQGIARELRKRLATLSAIAVTFMTITSVPAVMTMVAPTGGTAADQRNAMSTDRAAMVPRDQRPSIGSHQGGHYLATDYTSNQLHVATRALNSEIR